MKLTVRDLTFRYENGLRDVLSGFNFVAEPGSYWCIAGPNGTGKSTLLKLACGLIPVAGTTGEILWDEKPVARWTRLELARKIGFVPGALRSQFPLSVREFVIQGRYAHSTKIWAHPTKDDARITFEQLERVGIATLADKSITEISAGETQLSMIARALAQQPEVLILDEATAHLDLGYQLRIFDLLAELNKKGLTILIVSHDINLAAEFCPNAVWIHNGLLYAEGKMEDTLTTDLMRDLYGVEGRIDIGRNPFTGRPKIFWKA